MAKHLSNRDIEKIVELLDGWADKLTWEELCEACGQVIGTIPTRQTLSKFVQIHAAYRACKERLKKGVPELPQLPSIRAAQERIQRLERENERLKKENHGLLEQFVVWQYNAYAGGFTEVKLNTALPNIDRANT